MILFDLICLFLTSCSSWWSCSRFLASAFSPTLSSSCVQEQRENNQLQCSRPSSPWSRFQELCALLLTYVWWWQCLGTQCWSSLWSLACWKQLFCVDSWGGSSRWRQSVIWRVPGGMVSQNILLIYRGGEFWILEEISDCVCTRLPELIVDIQHLQCFEIEYWIVQRNMSKIQSKTEIHQFKLFLYMKLTVNFCSFQFWHVSELNGWKSTFLNHLDPGIIGEENQHTGTNISLQSWRWMINPCVTRNIFNNSDDIL